MSKSKSNNPVNFPFEPFALRKSLIIDEIIIAYNYYVPIDEVIGEVTLRALLYALPMEELKNVHDRLKNAKCPCCLCPRSLFPGSSSEARILRGCLLHSVTYYKVDRLFTCAVRANDPSTIEILP